MKTLYRKDRIRMFIIDYYWGYGKLISLLRIIGGPSLILIGLDLFVNGFDKFSVAYSGVLIIYGIYMILKPYLWVLFRLENYKTENVSIAVFEDYMTIKDELNESKVSFDAFKNIIESKGFFTFIISKSQRLRLPKSIFETEELRIIKSKIKPS